MALITWAEDRALDDAGAHGLSRSNAKRARWRGRRKRTLWRAGGGGFGRGLLGGGLLSGIFGLLSGLLGIGNKKSAHRGRHARPGGGGRGRRGRKPKILRATAAHGIKRPVVRDQPRVTREAGTTRRPQVTFQTGVFNVNTRRLVRRRLLG